MKTILVIAIIDTFKITSEDSSEGLYQRGIVTKPDVWVEQSVSTQLQTKKAPLR